MTIAGFGFGGGSMVVGISLTGPVNSRHDATRIAPILWTSTTSPATTVKSRATSIVVDVPLICTVHVLPDLSVSATAVIG